MLLNHVKIGLELIENILMINRTCHTKINEGMVFNVLLTFPNIKLNDKIFAIYLSDTIIIGKNTGNQVITYEVSRKYEEVSYNLNE